MTKVLRNQSGFSIIELIIAHGISAVIFTTFVAMILSYFHLQKSLGFVEERDLIHLYTNKVLNTNNSCSCSFRDIIVPSSINANTVITYDLNKFRPHSTSYDCSSPGKEFFSSTRFSNTSIESAQLQNINVVEDDYMFADLEISVKDIKSSNHPTAAIIFPLAFNLKKVGAAIKIENCAEDEVIELESNKIIEDLPFHMGITNSTYTTVPFNVPAASLEVVYNLTDYPDAKFIQLEMYCRVKMGKGEEYVAGSLSFWRGNVKLYESRPCKIRSNSTTMDTDHFTSTITLKIPSLATQVKLKADIETPAEDIATRSVAGHLYFVR